MPRALFRQHIAAGVLRVTEEFVTRTLDQLGAQTSSGADARFAYFLVSQLEGDALARAMKRWPHAESQVR